jgi:hypothetical protein
MKVPVNFDDHTYNTKVKELNNIARALTEAVKLSKIITGGEVRTTNSKDLNNWLNLKTGFPNSLSNATLLDVGVEYKSFLDLETIYKSFDVTLFEVVKEVYKTSLNALEAITINCTEYLKEDKVNDYIKLEKSAKILNSLPPNPLRLFKTNYLGKLSVNLHLLQHSDLF